MQPFTVGTDRLALPPAALPFEPGNKQGRPAMAPQAPMRESDLVNSPDALAWAQLAGLVAILPDGSWRLTPLGRAGMAALLGSAHSFARHDRPPRPFLVR
jgi:hypothetical protein